jgi:hypothetical protein
MTIGIQSDAEHHCFATGFFVFRLRHAQNVRALTRGVKRESVENTEL